jgi:hypothetical protein
MAAAVVHAATKNGKKPAARQLRPAAPPQRQRARASAPGAWTARDMRREGHALWSGRCTSWRALLSRSATPSRSFFILRFMRSCAVADGSHSSARVLPPCPLQRARIAPFGVTPSSSSSSSLSPLANSSGAAGARPSSARRIPQALCDKTCGRHQVRSQAALALVMRCGAVAARREAPAASAHVERCGACGASIATRWSSTLAQLTLPWPSGAHLVYIYISMAAGLQDPPQHLNAGTSYNWANPVCAPAWAAACARRTPRMCRCRVAVLCCCAAHARGAPLLTHELARYPPFRNDKPRDCSRLCARCFAAAAAACRAVDVFMRCLLPCNRASTSSKKVRKPQPARPLFHETKA